MLVNPFGFAMPHEQLQEAKKEEPIHKHGERGTMRSRYQFDTGVDTGRKDTALMRAEPRWPGRLRLRLLAAVLIAAFAALIKSGVHHGFTMPSCLKVLVTKS